MGSMKKVKGQNKLVLCPQRKQFLEVFITQKIDVTKASKNIISHHSSYSKPQDVGR
jgi:hypothetical protein